jgi:general secretion pathway protein A
VQPCDGVKGVVRVPGREPLTVSGAMYEEFYGLREKPFSLTADPRYFYASESHLNAFELVHHAIRRRDGLVVLTGAVGTGKTTLCRAILDRLDRKTFAALVLNPFVTSEDLLRLLLIDFGVVSREELARGRLVGTGLQELTHTLREFLVSLLPVGTRALLMIDEAQKFHNQVLDQIRVLSSLERDHQALLQIVLIGQPSLKDSIRASTSDLEARVAIRYQLRALTPQETSEYVSHRLRVAGAGEAVSFTRRALHSVHRETGGIPRLINLVCDRAMVGAFSVRATRIESDVVGKAASSLGLEHARGTLFDWMRRRVATH